MATSPDSKTIDRESLKQDLATKYERGAKAGGAYNVQTDVKTNGANEISLGGSTFDKLYTTTKGFKIKMAQGQTELKDAAGGNTSRQLSIYTKGLDVRPYKK